MDQKIVKRHYQQLAHFLKGLVTERFKRMAKDDVLFRFISSRVDPALLVDHLLQAEREALDLSEMSLFKLVDHDRLMVELRKTSERIQKNFQDIFGSDVSNDFTSDEVVDRRVYWLSSRVDFYRKMLSLSLEVDSPTILASKAFRNLKIFQQSLVPLVQSDRDYAEAIVQATHSLHRFLMRKHLEYELKNAEELWIEFAAEAFRTMPELTE